ncbi:hypothetical protein B0H10DRAFT_1672849, partial [Mycena sp. CBHHK59/15]
LRSGAVVLHMNSVVAADWLRLPGQMHEFLAGMGGMLIFKQRNPSLVMEFVPVSFNPSQDGALKVLEDDNNLGKGEIPNAQFIKKAEKRHNGQHSAHAIFGFASRKAANRVIDHGMFIDGKRIFGWKLLSEPIQCLKCQMIGVNHTAASCTSIHDVCARCGEMHRTTMCGVADNARACSNCGREKRSHRGHGAADHGCPVFIDKLQFNLERNPEAPFKFFLTEDPATW